MFLRLLRPTNGAGSMGTVAPTVYVSKRATLRWIKSMLYNWRRL